MCSLFKKSLVTKYVTLPSAEHISSNQSQEDFIIKSYYQI